jgi:hypothetical protein
MADNAKPTANSGGNRKVNLSTIQAQLVRRGKPSYENPALEADILSLDPSVEGDAFYWGEAKVNLKADSDTVNNEKMKYRTRAISIAKRLNRPIAIHWTAEGEMIISLK